MLSDSADVSYMTSKGTGQGNQEAAKHLRRRLGKGAPRPIREPISIVCIRAHETQKETAEMAELERGLAKHIAREALGAWQASSSTHGSEPKPSAASATSAELQPMKQGRFSSQVFLHQVFRDFLEISAWRNERSD